MVRAWHFLYRDSAIASSAVLSSSVHPDTYLGSDNVNPGCNAICMDSKAYVEQSVQVAHKVFVSKMKIAYFIDTLWQSGGTERVLTTKLNWLASQPDVQVAVVTIRDNRPPFFSLDERIERVELPVNNKNLNFAALLAFPLVASTMLWHLRKACLRPVYVP